MTTKQIDQQCVVDIPTPSQHNKPNKNIEDYNFEQIHIKFQYLLDPRNSPTIDYNNNKVIHYTGSI